MSQFWGSGSSDLGPCRLCGVSPGHASRRQRRNRPVRLAAIGLACVGSRTAPCEGVAGLLARRSARPCCLGGPVCFISGRDEGAGLIDRAPKDGLGWSGGRHE
ncbi:hypothetical protein NDU88_002176 [Pleurodeles waltl]|uniref:Uncharacterized protein n=1 Tax=Pleurodeles waltl TaxID=8319 RepID=A0AAV7V9U4_PLEWA|nr:hypothetical protein NDU88_002176 [Pleurodeles waltl]